MRTFKQVIDHVKYILNQFVSLKIFNLVINFAAFNHFGRFNLLSEKVCVSFSKGFEFAFNI